MRRLLGVALAGWIFLLVAGAREAAAQPQQTAQFSLNITKAGQPVANVQVQQVGPGGAQVVGTTDPSGSLSFVFNLANKPKVSVQIIEEQCPDGTIRTYVVAVGAQLQPEDPKCPNRRRVVGAYFEVEAGQIVRVTVDVALDTLTVTPTRAAPQFPGAPPRVPLFSFLGGGAIGFKSLGGNAGEAAFPLIFSTATFTTAPTAFSGSLNGELVVARFIVFDVEAWRARAITSNGSGTTLGGGTDNAQIKQQFEGFAALGGVKIPLPWNASFIVNGGGNFWRVNITTTETVTTGTGRITATTKKNIDDRGWKAGAAVQWDATPRWTIFMAYDYLPMNNAGVNNIHLNEASFGVLFRIFGASK